MPVTDDPMEPAVSRTCSTTRLITLRPCGVRAAAAPALAAPTAAAPIAARFATFLTVRLRAVARPPLAPARLFAALDPARFLLDPRFAEDVREDDRPREDDFFDDRERFEEDFVERFLEEDRLRDAMGFLLF
jgi:hypothetical protein